MDEGAATAEQLVAALDAQLTQTPQFGKLALGRKLLSIPQIWRILNHQADHGGRFGEISIELGYLSRAQVQEILVLQLESRPKLGEVLVQQGVIEEAKLREFLERYHIRRMTDELGAVPEGEQDEWPGEDHSHARMLAAPPSEGAASAKSG